MKWTHADREIELMRKYPTRLNSDVTREYFLLPNIGYGDLCSVLPFLWLLKDSVYRWYRLARSIR
ncbi:hypothetical protein [Desulfocastanea catecholica]